MCQLLGMNAAEPTDFSFSFKGFARRGGDSDKHCDGWGIAFYENCGLRCFLDPAPAAQSPIAELVARYPVKTHNMMGHVRYATKGDAGRLENCHPFQRELWGIHFCFVHNGDIPKFYLKNTLRNGGDLPSLGLAKFSKCPPAYHPVGDTDSEACFCAILNALKAEFNTLPTLPVLYQTLQRLCDEIVIDTNDDADEPCINNFLLGCGQHLLFAFSWPGARPGSSCWNGLYYTVREYPFTEASLVDIDNYTVDFSDLNSRSDRVAVIATKPLTKNENWKEMKRGELLLFEKGIPYSAAKDCAQVEAQGGGLKSNCKAMLRLRSDSICSRKIEITDSGIASSHDNSRNVSTNVLRKGTSTVTERNHTDMMFPSKAPRMLKNSGECFMVNDDNRLLSVL